MADESITTPQVQPVELGRAEERIRQLSEKVELTSKERDEQARLLKEMSDKNATLEKENAFNSGFADVLGTHPQAKDHKDEIKAKVMAGYSPEDAAYAVLGKAGKIGGGTQPIASPAGGSAATSIQKDAEKSLSEMTRDEKRAALIERQGELADILAPKMRL